MRHTTLLPRPLGMPANRTPTSFSPTSTTPWSGLAWPHLFAAISLAFRPGRVFLAFVLAIALWAAAAFPAIWLHDSPTPLQHALELGGPVVDRLVESFFHIELVSAAESLRYLVIDLPGKVVAQQPWSTVATLLLGIIAWTILGGAIVRSTATEFAIRKRLSTRESAFFALSKVRSSAGAMLAPILIVAILAMILRGFGAIAAGSSFGGGVVALAFGLALVLALAAVLTFLGFLLGFPLLLAAVVCEGTDAIDALQRAYAYVLGRPVRLAWYSLVFYAQLALVSCACVVLAMCTTAFAIRWTFAPDTSDRLSHVTPFARDAHMAWMLLLFALAASFALSFFHAGSAVLYLLLRQVNDGQDPADLWQPGHAEAARAKMAHVDADDTSNGTQNAHDEGDDV